MLQSDLFIPKPADITDKVKPAIDPDLIDMTIYVKETADTRKKTLSRKATFKELLQQTSVQLSNDSYKLTCKIGNETKAFDYVNIKAKALENVFHNLSVGFFEITKVYVAGNQ